MRLPIDLSNPQFIAGSDPTGALDMRRLLQTQVRERVAVDQTTGLAAGRVIEHRAQRHDRAVATTAGKPLPHDLVGHLVKPQAPVSLGKMPWCARRCGCWWTPLAAPTTDR